jgi:two-component system CheB/CheR fusion protein
VEADQRPQEQQQALREVFNQLRLRTGHDFSNYKRPTLLRRIERRISVRNLPDLPAYAAYLLQQPQEAEALLKDLLISVTNFFRDPAVFTSLEQTVLPAILEKKKAEDTVRIWVAGCATGEEAYSLAMLAAEQTQGRPDAPKIQIFATDIDEVAINQAREGLYTLNDAADVSPERLSRFFIQEGDRYRISREIREMVLFARHNVLKDPPFSRMDLVSCRNLLIYFNHTAQERALETFHFALQQDRLPAAGSVGDHRQHQRFVRHRQSGASSVPEPPGDGQAVSGIQNPCPHYFELPSPRHCPGRSGKPSGRTPELR